ncbi:acyl-coenzyme A thioesterase THEM4 [Naviculisporaceae sp. PSN 640]
MKRNQAAVEAEIAHFRAIPWCAEMLSDPKLVVDQSFSRFEKPKFEDSLLSHTLNTPETIPGFITFYRPPEDPKAMVTELNAFISLGNLIDGWGGICHGGIIMTMLDEVMGQLPAVNKLRGNLPDVQLMTAYLNTKFLAPVRTPTVVMITSTLVKQEGRKYFINAVIRNERGQEMAKGEALFIMLKAKL